MNPLPDKQQKLFDYLKSYVEKHNNVPSFTEIKTQFGFSSLKSVYRQLHILKTKGLINITKNASKFIISTQKPLSIYNYTLPIIGVLNDDGEIVKTENFSYHPYASTKKLSSGTFLLKVDGGNFLEAGLLPDDMIVVEPRSEAIVGETILVKPYNEYYTIKKYFPNGIYTRLDSFCIQVEPMLVLHEEIHIQGAVIGSVREYS